MKSLIKHIPKITLMICSTIILYFGCTEDLHDWEVIEYGPGTIEGIASSTSVTNTEAVTFTDNSTKVYSRLWTFDGGNPSSSTEQEVVVTYQYGGVWEAKLEVTHVDNSVSTQTIEITVDGPAPIASLPYTGTAHALPGTIEAEDYDLGGEGTAYHDSDVGNNAIAAGSAVYRTDNDTDGDVDVQVGAVTNIGWTTGGEWLNFSVDVANTGTHTLDFILGSDPGGYSVQVSSIIGEDTTFLAESGDFSSTGGWGVYDSFKAIATLEAGPQIWHVYFTGGSTNLDKIIVTEGEPVIDPEVEASASSQFIDAGQTVTFTDNSTLVDSRTWTFDGGDPATSSEAEVTVTYNTPGTYNAVLDVNHTDGSTGQVTIEITVRDPNAEALPFAFYTERTEVDGKAMDTSNPNNTAHPSPANSGNFNLSYVTDAAEGNEAIYANYATSGTGNDVTWGAMVSMFPVTSPLDLSRHNYYNISLKAPAKNTDALRIRLRTNGGNYWVTLANQYGFARDGQWHTLKIPFSDLTLNGDGTTALEGDRTEVTEVIFRSDVDAATLGENFDWYIDDIYFTVD